MAQIRISLTCADYARVMPLATGEVKPEGIALTMVLGSRGSWPARAEMLRRAVQDPEVEGGEWSMAQYLYRIEDTAAAMGEDFHPYGLERNCAQIEMFAGEAFRLGLTSRPVSVDEYFADYLAS